MQIVYWRMSQMVETLKPILERMREMQRLAENFGAPIRMSALDYKAVADEIEHLQTYAQHRPTCAVIDARMHGNPYAVPDGKMCNCGLLSKAAELTMIDVA
jgi:hypothetical protein